MTTASSRPVPVRRRPANRRQQITTAAGDLFAERGYHNVSLAEVAAVVDITAPSLYRHFRNKHDLLRAVVHASMEGTDEMVSATGSIEALLKAFAARCLDRRSAPILWQRESRHLADSDRAELWDELTLIESKVSELIRRRRPELSPDDARLLAWATTSIYSSVSFHRVTIPRRAYERLLVSLGESVVSCDLYGPGGEPENAPERPPAPAIEGFPSSMRETLLNEAVRLFDQRGFRSVSTDDIGAAVGTSGPNIYKHFTTKTELLEAAVLRAGERRRSATSEALVRAQDPADLLGRLVDSYVGFAIENSHLLGVLVSELDQLPEVQRRASRQSQRDFLALWVGVLTQDRPELDPKVAKITVLATLAVVDNVVRTPPLSARPDLAARLSRICLALLENPHA
ncbi:TetR/AcrR family transcriptional regulator [Mumia sp. Pv 4-285]|uniref:TetR/AcrR family transcriptional regulator n=1 Tax=Mumia qirimensis TaxID=3234852 RepID=UPI00351D9A04